MTPNREALVKAMADLEERLALLRGREKQKQQLVAFLAKRPDLTRTDVREVANNMPPVRLISPHAMKQAIEKRRATREVNAKKRGNGVARKKKR